MGSYNMAFNKILFVLVAAGGSPAWAQSSLFGFSNNFQPAPATQSTTPVPILCYVDNQNIDGSYTYGYEAADGTYKLETRYVDGRVKVVNGRRALVKKVRRVKATPAPKQFIDEQATKQANLKARQEQLRTLEEHRRQLLEVQRQQQRQQG